METLLSHVFDHLSTFDAARIRKGLRLTESLLATFCLPKGGGVRKVAAAAAAVASDAERPATPPSPSPRHKGLADVTKDAGFREYFQLQESFEWNIVQRLLPAIEWMYNRGKQTGDYDKVIMGALDLLRGLLLLHPPSRVLISRPYMNLLLDLIAEPQHDCSSPSPAVQCAAITTLVIVLLDAPQNARLFEQEDGLFTVTSLFRSSESTREVKFRTAEFLYFYLTPEAPPGPGPRAKGRAAADASPVPLQPSPSKLAKVFGQGKSASANAKGGRRAGSGGDGTRSVERKKALVEEHLPGCVEALLGNLERYRPFGGALE